MLLLKSHTIFSFNNIKQIIYLKQPYVCMKGKHFLYKTDRSNVKYFRLV